VRSLRDQELVLERQHLSFARESLIPLPRADGFLADREHDFVQYVEALLARASTYCFPTSFDDWLRKAGLWPKWGSRSQLRAHPLPSPQSRPEARAFCTDNTDSG